ncbi:MAG: Bor family protein [Gemmatimonadaceae bacterium]
MRRVTNIALLGALALTAGCFHAVIETGRPASGTIVENKWASGFIYGLVPPAVVNTASQCPNGVSRVETQHTFLNQLASFVTFGIYSPITITVACASGGSASASESIDAGATIEEQTAAMSKAADRAVETGAPVFLKF